MGEVEGGGGSGREQQERIARYQQELKIHRQEKDAKLREEVRSFFNVLHNLEFKHFVLNVPK